MGLVTAKEVAKAINTDKYGILGNLSGWLLMKLLKISNLNDMFDRNKHLSDVEFLNLCHWWGMPNYSQLNRWVKHNLTQQYKQEGYYGDYQ